MMSGRGIKPHQFGTSTSDQEDTPDTRIDSSTGPQQQSKRNTSKRPKDGDDSFEREYRMVNASNQYFNSTPSSITNPSSTRPSFPPFRLNFTGDETPSELSIIKCINKHCRISLSFGRYSSLGSKKSFLLYANSNEQFDRLMDKKIWPVQIGGFEFTVIFPSKVPSSYSIVATGVPAQWNLTEFEADIKKQYPTIIKVERLFIKGGIPISKVRIDFSSNQEINKILKNKRLLLDDENTSFAIQPYSPPFRVLRCFNCQQYNDHIAANCPHKNNPICFRCGQNHPYNPQCLNKICCANCQQDHMAGNPNCPAKIEERRKYHTNITSSTTNNQKQVNSSSSVWTANGIKFNTHIRPPSPMENAQVNADQGVVFLDISKKLDLMMIKMEHLSAEQSKINLSINNSNQLINQCHKEINSMKEFIMNKFCPYVYQLSEAFLGKNKQVEKDKLRSLFIQFKLDSKEAAKSTDYDQRSNVSLPNSSSNESIGNDV
jgi:hypothetical protein